MLQYHLGRSDVVPADSSRDKGQSAAHEVRIYCKPKWDTSYTLTDLFEGKLRSWVSSVLVS